MTIYVITHINADLELPDGYRKLLVGAHNKENFSGDLCDDKGENISQRNNAYSELTGLYWIWKNTNEDICGLVHYRRYFVNIKKFFLFRGRYIMFNTQDAYSLLKEEEIINYLQGSDLIVKETEWRMKTNRQNFVGLLGTALWKQLTDVISEKFPDYLIYFYEEEKKHTHYNCNMFVGYKCIIDKYCEWLFTILESMDEKQLKETGQNYHCRELGYVSEFLFEVWITKNKISKRVVPVVNTNDSYAVNGIMDIPQFIKFICKMIYKYIGKKHENI